MIEFVCKDYTEAAWREVFDSLQGQSLLQTSAYGEAKAQTGPWRIERGVFRRDGELVGACQVLLRDVPIFSGGLAWAGRGPLFRDSHDVAEMCTVLAEHYCRARGYYLRIAPPLGSNDFPEAAAQQAGFRDTGTAGWASATIDLSLGLKALRANLGGKWRGHLNKAERSNLRIEIGADLAAVSEFLSAHQQFLDAHQFDTAVTPDFLGILQERLADGLKMEAVLAYDDGGILVASALIAKYGDTCEYLAGNSTDAGRRSAAVQLLLWRAIERMKAHGFATFDVSGMDPEVTPRGIYQFKQGMGGVPYRQMSEIEAGGGSLIGRLVRWRVRRARAALAGG